MGYQRMSSILEGGEETKEKVSLGTENGFFIEKTY